MKKICIILFIPLHLTFKTFLERAVIQHLLVKLLGQVDKGLLRSALVIGIFCAPSYCESQSLWRHLLSLRIRKLLPYIILGPHAALPDVFLHFIHGCYWWCWTTNSCRISSTSSSNPEASRISDGKHLLNFSLIYPFGSLVFFFFLKEGFRCLFCYSSFCHFLLCGMLIAYRL